MGIVGWALLTFVILFGLYTSAFELSARSGA
jgi:hypothetical protein